jgi:hypothetical protein
MTFGGLPEWSIRAQSGVGTAPVTAHHITTSSGCVRAYVPRLANAEQPTARLGVVHKLACGFRVRREESAPGEVVPPTASRLAHAVEEAQPVLHVCFGNPHPLLPSVLRKGHDVGHGSSLRQVARC